MAQASGDSTTDIIQTSSAAGELAPNLWGRTDFEKYDSAWAEIINWFCDYRGPLLSRAGLEFGDYIDWIAGNDVKFVPFQFSPQTSDTYVCVFTNSVVRFIQDNAWVLEAPKTVASVANGSGNKLTITSSAHGFNNNDLVKLGGFVQSTLTFLNGRTVRVANKATNTFDIEDAVTSALIIKASITTGTGTASRVYTIASPYADSDLQELNAKQINDFVRLTHGSYPIKNLIRSGATSWAISDETIGQTLGQPTNLTATPETSRGKSCVYMVSAVTPSGEEGLPQVLPVTSGDDLFGGTDRVNKVAWTPVVGAESYRIYRSIVCDDAGNLSSDVTVGYIGTSYSPAFADQGITPDFDQQPRFGYNPFANAAIQYVSVSVQGTGYKTTSVITWPTGGSGAVGFPIVPSNAQGSSSAPLTGIRVLWGGANYTGTSMSLSIGTGATVTATLSPSSGNNPYTSTLFQQRMLYAGTDNFQLRLFGSRPGFFSNFNDSGKGLDDDVMLLDLDSSEDVPIRHLIPVMSALIVFLQTEVWLVYAADSTKTVTANNGRADIQSKIGANYTSPIIVDNVLVVYAADSGQDLHMLSYDSFYHQVKEQNLSLLSNHLFTHDNELIRLTYAMTPYKLVYGLQASGRIVTCAVDTTNDVYAMSQMLTQGYFRECLAIEENSSSSVYVAVERVIQSTRCLFFERQHLRNWTQLEGAFCVDAGLTLGSTMPAGRLTPSSLSGPVTFTVAGATPFAAGDVGKDLRCGDGLARIGTYTSSTQVAGTWTRPLTTVIPQTTTPASFDSGNWTLDAPITAVSGLWHLIGQPIAILADGLPVTATVDSFGGFTLATAASRITAGLSYRAQAKSLPPSVQGAVIEGRRKDVVGLGLKVNDTYGLQFGESLDHLYMTADKKNRLWGTSPRLRNESLDEFIKASWKRDSQYYLVQDSPQPAGILSVIRDTDLGDTKQ